ncbi:MAG TPA: class I mannose-6-phosphate isomerase, partial [Polyangiaceae bacterium LLY-WYZ-15_(1-7)]|nr:class I mannose-6-phosphate isomerase [Polyangiaceae bacterium LLY-WYZ-15_(1-7)]
MSYILPPRKRPLRLQPDNFTPARRTPWGGRRLLERYKDGLVPPRNEVVGESWELSVEPDFPSRLADEDATLAERVAADPEGLVGAERAAEWGSTGLLVKLLDAAAPLSVQIHPSDDDPALGPEESGKPESWYVLDAEPGAGLYLGLAEGVDEAGMRQAIEAGEDVSALLPFVPVAPGDFFVIEAGTPHAIGPGLTLVEPQRVLPGRRGLTYRYWDWNRRYDAEGREDPAGAPRELHLERALAVTRWDRPRGEAFLPEVRRRHGAPDLAGPASRADLVGDLAFPWIGAERWAGTGALPVPAMPRLRSLTVLGGAVTLRGEGVALSLRRGETAALPAG